MPTFEIEQFELHASKYRLEAKNEADAIARLFDGEGTPVDNSLEFIEPADDYGLPATDYPKLVRGLRKHGIDASDCIPSIRSVNIV